MSISNPPIYIDKLEKCFKAFLEAYKKEGIKAGDFSVYVQELEISFSTYDYSD